MPEHEPRLEETRYTYEQVLEVLKRVVADGITDPDVLESSDNKSRNVMEAKTILNAWTEQLLRDMEGPMTDAEKCEQSFKISTVLIDAGFILSFADLEELANSSLEQDLEDAVRLGLTGLAQCIQDKINELRVILDDMY
jgi:hypothetical protein